MRWNFPIVAVYVYSIIQVASPAKKADFVTSSVALRAALSEKFGKGGCEP